MKEAVATVKLVKLTDARFEGEEVYQIDVEFQIPKGHDIARFDLQKFGPSAQMEGVIRRYYDPTIIPFSVIGKPDIRKGDTIPVFFFENREIHRVNRRMSATTQRRRRLF
jgi:hypothetical protein